jgi:hypothetical protein
MGISEALPYVGAGQADGKVGPLDPAAGGRPADVQRCQTAVDQLRVME